MNSVLETTFSSYPFSHHAYGIESDTDIYAELKTIIPAASFAYLIHKKYDTLKIDEIRTIKSLHAEKTEKGSLFVIQFTLVTREAQNALLKIIEEPTANTYFVLVFPSAKKLLPTLQSRLALLSYKNDTATVPFGKIDITKYSAMTLQERFDFNKKNCDKKQDEPLEKSDLMTFLNALEAQASENIRDNTELLETIYNARAHVYANGASIKMILDTLAMHMK